MVIGLWFFVLSISDPCIFTLKRDGCKPLIVGVYVDDLVVAHDSSTPDVFSKFIKALTKHFNASMRAASDGFWAWLLISQMIASEFRFTNPNIYTIVVRSSFQISNHITLKYDVPGSREQYAKLGFAETEEER